MKKRDIIKAMRETRDAFELTIEWLDRDIETAETEELLAYLRGKKEARLSDIKLIDAKLQVIGVLMAAEKK